MRPIKSYNESLILISYIECIRIFIWSVILGIWTAYKGLLFRILKSAKYDWNTIENPPLCLVDNTFGQHSYMKIRGGGIKLHYVEAGDKGKPMVVLLHGFPDCWISWFNQIPDLSEHFRVIAVDLKGFGDSDKPLSRRAYKLETLLEELTTFIQSFGVSRCAIVGHDMGALLGWYMAHLHSDLVSKFVAISSAHPNIHWREVQRKSLFNNNWIRLCQLPFLPELDALKNDLAIIDRCYKHLKDKGSECEEYIEAYKYTFSRKEDWTGALNYYRNLPFYRLDDHTLRSINVPCLLINGKMDDFVPLESIVKSAEFIQRYELKIIENARHYPHQENPKMVNDTLLDFLLDPPLLRRLNNGTTYSPGLIGKVMSSVTKSMRYSTKVLTGIRNTEF